MSADFPSKEPIYSETSWVESGIHRTLCACCAVEQTMSRLSTQHRKSVIGGLGVTAGNPLLARIKSDRALGRWH